MNPFVFFLFLSAFEGTLMVHGSWLLRAPKLLLIMPFTAGGLEYPSALACLAGRLERTSSLVSYSFLSVFEGMLMALCSWLMALACFYVADDSVMKIAINAKRVGISERSGMVTL